MIPDIDSFDIDAAILRRSENDLRAFLGALAARLENAVPHRVKIDRKRDGLLSSRNHVVRVELVAEDAAYVIALERSGVQTTRAKVVRGVILSTSQVPPGDWLTEIRAAISRMSGLADNAANSIHKFL